MNRETYYQEEIGLNRYYDDLEKMLRIQDEAYLHFDELYIPPKFRQERTEAESGWGYTGRFNGECGNFLPVDLNSLLYKYEMDFSDFASLLGSVTEAQEWKKELKKENN